MNVEAQVHLNASASMDISEVARRSGLTSAALRFYESKGLIHPVGRHAGKRLFHVGVLERLALIGLGRAAGFSLAHIADMLPAHGEVQIDRDLMLARADAIDKQIRHLQAVRDSLRHVAQCPAPSHLECPNFRALMQEAISGHITAMHAAASKAKSE